MWLLNTAGLTLHLFDAKEVPPYAILSHVWRGEEQSFQDVMAIHARANQGDASMLRNLSAKIRSFCSFAEKAGYKWVWIDNCCIDKGSSAELSEALNSMYSWYANADMCYAFLDDIRGDEDPRAPTSAFRRSQWFTRGWTLQELLAPHSVIFMSPEWQSVGSNHALADILAEITGIDEDIVTHKMSLNDVSVARRMSWASARETRRIEDRAYSLMGIFSVNMPTVYGEGGRAFTRLQEEILKQLPDQSIFAWGPLVHIDHGESTRRMHQRPLSPATYRTRVAYERHRSLQGLFAQSPADFAHSGNIRPLSFRDLSEALGIQVPVPVYHPTSGGLRIQLPIIQDEENSAVVKGLPVSVSFAVLACQNDSGHLLVLYLRRDADKGDGFAVGFPTKRRYLRTAFWDKESGSTGGARVVDVYVMHRRPSTATLPYFPLHNFDATSAYLKPTGPVTAFFFLPVWVLSRLRTSGFVPAQNTGSWGIQPLRTDDGVSVDVKVGESPESTKVSSLLFWRSMPVYVGSGASYDPTGMRLSFGIGCTCPPTNTVEDIWLDVDLDTYPTPHISASGKTQSTERKCTHSHLTRHTTKLRFERGPTLIECRVAPWCGYPMRSSGIASCQYLVDVSITESIHDHGGGSVPIRTSYDIPAYAGYPDPNFTTPPSMVGPQSHVPHPMPRYRTPPAFHTPVVTFGGLEERTITPHSQVYHSYSPLLYGSDTHQVISSPYSPYTALPGPVNAYPSSSPRPPGPPYPNPSGARRPSYSAGPILPRNPYANVTYSHPLTPPRQADSSHPPKRSPFPVPSTDGGLDLHGALGEGWAYNPLLEEPRPRIPIGPEGFPRIPPVQTYPQERGTPPVIPVAPMPPYEPMAFNQPNFRPNAHVPAKPRHIPRGRPRSVSPSSASSEASARSPRSQSRDVIPPPPRPASPESVRSMSTPEQLIEPSPLPGSPPKVPRPSYPSSLPRRNPPPWRRTPSPRSPISQSPPLLKKPTPAESPLPSKLPLSPGSPPPRGSSPPRWPALHPPSWPRLSTPSPVMITVIPPTPRLDKLGEAKSDAEPLEITRHPKSCCSSWSGRRRHTL